MIPGSPPLPHKLTQTKTYSTPLTSKSSENNIHTSLENNANKAVGVKSNANYMGSFMSIGPKVDHCPVPRINNSPRSTVRVDHTEISLDHSSADDPLSVRESRDKFDATPTSAPEGWFKRTRHILWRFWRFEQRRSN